MQRQHPSARSVAGVRNPVAGQAMLEFTVALILLLIILTGMIHLSNLSRYHLAAQAMARDAAGAKALSDGAVSEIPEAIADWTPGPDGQLGTADDEAVYSMFSRIPQLVDPSVRDSGDWRVVRDSTLPVSPARLANSPFPMGELGFTQGTMSIDTLVDPFIRELVYAKRIVRVEETIWMPLLGGLY